MKHIIYTLLFLISFNGVAQEFADKEYYLVDSLVLNNLSEGDRGLIDSCLKIFHGSQYDSTKISALNSICDNMIHDDWGKYQYYQYDIIREALKSNPSKEFKKSLLSSNAYALNNIGIIHELQGKFSDAQVYYTNSSELYIKIGEKDNVPDILNSIGRLNEMQGNFFVAITYFKKSLKLSQEIKYKEGISVGFNNLANIYINQGNFTKAISYFHKSLKICEEIDNKDGISQVLNNIGSLYCDQGNLTKVSLLTLQHRTLFGLLETKKLSS